MVWARTKMMIHDDILSPRPKLTFEYGGPRPEKFYNEIPELIRSIFRVQESQIQEKKFYWTKGDPEKFNIVWEVNKELDRFSILWLEIKLSGSSPSQGHGTAAISIEGAIRTEYPQDTFWQKSLVYEFIRMLWHKLIYMSQRNRYMGEGKRLMSLFVDEIKRLTMTA